MRRDFAAVLAALVSLGIHAGLMAWLVSIPAQADAGSRPVNVQPRQGVPGAPTAAQAGAGRVRTREIPIELGSPASAQNVDRARRGGGGEGRAAQDAVLLAMSVDDIRLQDAPWNALGVAQLQRIETDAARASWDNRRATPNPNDQPFLASGAGTIPERRPVAARDPSSGAPRASARSAAGDEGARAAAPDEGERAGGSDAAGDATEERATGAMASPGVGVARGEGARESRAANVAMGRPPVDEGPAATLASERERPRDDTNSELLATQLTQSWVDASPRSGVRTLPGNGGAGGGGSPGAGGSSGEGGQARAHTPGSGTLGALDTRDARYQAWLLTHRRRVQRAMVFPLERQLRMDQGVVVYSFAVDHRGRLVGTPRLTRSSGFADFDAAALRAIEETLPTAPPPSELMTGRADFPVRMSLDFSNPMVR